MTTRIIPAPTPTVDTVPFWQATAEGRFLIKRCNDCDEAHWYPRAICPFCLSSATVWLEASGEATIYSFTVVRHATAPYALAFVRLDEGPVMLTNIVDCDFETLAIDQCVRVVFKPTDGDFTVAVFTPADTRGIS